jgi:calcium-dependent protein kinase
MSTGKVTDTYDVDSAKLGEGAFGSVSKCVNKFTHTPAALKTVRKAQLRGSSMGRLRQEISIMKKLDHPNIIKLYESFEDHRNIYLVLELCLGGELFDRIIAAGHFSEVQAAIAMRQLFRGIYYMHENQVCHRDLKPENLLLATKEPIERNTLKIIDFGFARQFRAGTMLTTKAGTAYYISPQVLDGRYDQTADLWSCGVIMFVLLCGKPPFNGNTEEDIMANVRTGRFRFTDRDWRCVSDDAKSLVSALLQLDPKERCTAERALRHVWIMQAAPRARDVDLAHGMVDNLKAFKAQNKLKKAALHVIASQMSESQIHQLRAAFEALDENGDGLLTAAELRDGMAKAGFSDIPTDLQQILEAVDSNSSGVIDYTEFLAATLDKQAYMKEDICWAAFRAFDRDGNGTISKEELALVLQDRDVAAVAMRDVAELLGTLDTNGDGEIDFQEFMQMMTANGDDGLC